MATVMLEGKADIRFIQQMLGHAKLTTTQLYTPVSIPLLKAFHIATHPAARPSYPPAGETGAPVSAGPDSTHERDLADAPAGLLPRARSGA